MRKHPSEFIAVQEPQPFALDFDFREVGVAKANSCDRYGLRILSHFHCPTNRDCLVRHWVCSVGFVDLGDYFVAKHDVLAVEDHL